MKSTLFAKFGLAVILLCISAQSLATHANCAVAGGTLMKWPATGAATWELCWLPPSQSSGVDGSGLEVRDVHYKGILVAKRIHSPILFAEYRDGNGGDCYRDWKDTNDAFAAAPAVRNQLGTPTTLHATTTCDVSQQATTSHGACPFSNLSPNPYTAADCLNGGVAIEDNGSYVVLTTQYSAAWYRYSSRISFYANGDINPEFGFGNANGTYNNVTHWHHNYWRMDFDIDGATHDQIIANGVTKATEFTDIRSLTGAPGGTPSYWEVRDGIENFGYRITSGAGDYTPVNESGRGYHMADVIGTHWINNEYADQASNNLSDCQMASSNLANGESIADTDVVLYYTASVRDSTNNNWPTAGAGAIPQDSMVCKKVGPLITPVGDWPIFRDSFE
ncbi:MAG: hypothetical protein ABI411_08585 [Tahibacter sp.]